MELRDFIVDLQPERHSRWGWQNYRPTLEKLAAALGGNASALEIGGGRSPSFSAEESARLFGHYTVNDISRKELDLAPAHVNKTCFDIAGKDALSPERYDLIFSKMVFEHVRDARQAWTNTLLLLKDGGVALHFFPTLYCPPFVINRLLPEALSSRILKFFSPARNEGEHPKFPAFYDWCFSTRSNEVRIRAQGFSEAEAVPFYHHGYFQKIPGLKQIDAKLAEVAEQRDWRAFTSYVYMLVRK